MKAFVDRALSTLLVLAAVAIAVVLVRRELTLEPPARTHIEESGYVTDWRSILAAGHFVWGDEEAPIKLIEFVDFECPFCRHFHATLAAIRKQYGDDQVAYIFVHLPLTMHRFAESAARASECARVLHKFNDFADVVFEKQDSIGLMPWVAFAWSAGIQDTSQFRRCLADTTRSAVIEAGRNVAARLNVLGTPTVILNGWRYGGPPSQAELVRAIDDLLVGRAPYPGYPRGGASHPDDS